MYLIKQEQEFCWCFHHIWREKRRSHFLLFWLQDTAYMLFSFTQSTLEVVSVKEQVACAMMCRLSFLPCRPVQQTVVAGWTHLHYCWPISIHSVKNYLLNVNHLSNPLLGCRDIAVNKTTKKFCPYQTKCILIGHISVKKRGHVL